MDPDEARLGLCATCRFRRDVPGARSTFYMCDRSRTDPRFPRYPPLPVIRCPGYSPRDSEDPEEPSVGGGGGREKHGKL